MMKLYVADIECLRNEQTFEEHLCKVNERRRTKVLRCKNEEDRRRTLMAGVLLRYGLEQKGLCYADLEFAVTQEGKPYLVSNPEVFFNLSHSGKYAVCLIAEQNVGVDVESKQRKLLADHNKEKLLSMAKRSFTSEECEMFLGTSEEQQTELFLKLWTRKEAYSKAIGKGLAMDFSKIIEPDEKYLSFWLDEEYYISIYCEKDKVQKEDVEICLMN